MSSAREAVKIEPERMLKTVARVRRIKSQQAGKILSACCGDL
jgi:hypothetical protein